MADEFFTAIGGQPETPNEPKRVLRTGLAVVHEGELVLPAAGSEAQTEPFDSDRAVIVYYPVHIEVRYAEADRRQIEELIKQAFERFGAEVDASVVA